MFRVFIEPVALHNAIVQEIIDYFKTTTYPPACACPHADRGISAEGQVPQEQEKALKQTLPELRIEKL